MGREGGNGKENEAHAGLAQLRNTLSLLPCHLPATVTQHWEQPACCCCFPVHTWLRYAHAQLRVAEEAPPWAEVGRPTSPSLATVCPPH